VPGPWGPASTARTTTMTISGASALTAVLASSNLLRRTWQAIAVAARPGTGVQARQISLNLQGRPSTLLVASPVRDGPCDGVPDVALYFRRCAELLVTSPGYDE
jgi:hypothetical protein